MAVEMILICIIIVALIGIGLLEYYRYQRVLEKIPVRIHVNGSRGKSSVTRLIAAGLNSGGLRTYAKTTGSAACLIFPDGSETPIPRRGPVTIREQFSIINNIVRTGADVFVSECMALQPDLQRFLEEKVMRSTIGVITNVRPDHLDIMGPGLENVAQALAGTIPNNGVLFSTEKKHIAHFKNIARKKNTKVIKIPENLYPSENELGKFSYIEHSENVALALGVCQYLGIHRNQALQAMWNCTPDPGVLQKLEFYYKETRCTFINAFAANDVESTQRIIESLQINPQPDNTVIAIVNIRADRPQRAKEFSEYIAESLRADKFILTGEMSDRVKKMAKKKSLHEKRITILKNKSAEDVIKYSIDNDVRKCTIVGVGNIGGMGMDIVNFCASLLQK